MADLGIDSAGGGRPLRVVIVNFTAGRDNWGCQATSWCLKSFFETTLASEASVHVDTVPFPPRHLVDSLVGALFYGRLRDIFAARAPSETDLRFLESLARLRFRHLLRRVRQADIVVFQGEGTIGPDEHWGGLRLFALPFLAKHLWQKPVLSVNQTLYARLPWQRNLLAAMFAAYDLVAVREPISLRLCREIGLKHAVLCPDFAFRAESRGDAGSAPILPDRYFCISGSAALELLAVDSLITAIHTIAVESGLLPVFLYSKEIDARLPEAMHALHPQMRHAAIGVRDCGTYCKLLPILRRAAFAISGRFHVAILALTQATPVILLPGNTDKLEGLAGLLDLALPVLDPAAPDGIVAAAATLLKDREDRSHQISQAVRRLDDDFSSFARLIGSLMYRSPSGAVDYETRLAQLRQRLQPAITPSPGRHHAVYAHANRHRGVSLGKVRRPTGASRLESALRWLSLSRNLRVFDVALTPSPSTMPSCRDEGRVR